MLGSDHDAVVQVLEKLEETTRRDQKQKLADQICTELIIHATIEEEMFYPEICRGVRPV